jgi:uncharacterized protein (DUF305 family)
MKKPVLILGALALFAAAPLLAQTMKHDGKGKMDHSGHAAAADTPATAAYKKAMGGMMKGMDIAYTGNSDADFAGGMVPHHMGAVEMAKVELAFGKDAEMRKLAEDIIKAQETEIAFMTEWLKKNPPK